VARRVIPNRCLEIISDDFVKMNLLVVCGILLAVYWLTKDEEKFGWNCTFSPNVDYYKEDWLLGGNPAAESLARGGIKSALNF
jgi:hypothetical protein